MSVTETVIREQFPFWTSALEQAVPAPGDLTVVIGCGTSYYLGQAIAAALNASGRLAMAVPGGEWVQQQESYLSDPQGWTVLGLSRSGSTTETLEALRLSRAAGLRTVALTCESDSPICHVAAECLDMPTHGSEGIVMSASASLMLLQGLRMAGRFLPDDLPDRAEAAMRALDQQVDRITHERRHFVYLGSGPHYGIACEGALKLMEMSLSPAQAFHPMEFRHGPISLIDGESVVVMLYSPEGGAEERSVVRDVRAKGALVIGLDGPGDVEITTGLEGPEAGLAALPALQLMGERVARAKGIDTAQPRHLTKVVVLD